MYCNNATKTQKLQGVKENEKILMGRFEGKTIILEDFLYILSTISSNKKIRRITCVIKISPVISPNS